MSKATRYSSKEKDNEFEDMSNRLASELRGKIRQMHHYPMFSEQWCDMADVCGRIASISDVELAMSASKAEGTLWETEEQAIRFLIEDGKLNMCLRSLIDFKQHQRRSLRNGTVESIRIAEKSDLFEKGLGSLLKNAWLHIEALQTTDIDALVSHIADVLEYCIENPEYCKKLADEKDLHQRQEVMVFYYLASLLQQVDNIEESRIMPAIRAKKVFMIGSKCVDMFGSALPKPMLLKSIEALSLLTETEEFSTYRDQHIDVSSSSIDMEVLYELKEKFLQPLLSDLECRKVVRPLSDAIDKAKRSYSSNRK